MWVMHRLLRLSPATREVAPNAGSPPGGWAILCAFDVPGSEKSPIVAITTFSIAIVTKAAWFPAGKATARQGAWFLHCSSLCQ